MRAKVYLNNFVQQRILEKQEKWQEAVQCWDEGIAKLKRAPFFQAKKAKALQNLGRWKEATECWNQEINKNKNNRVLYVWKAQALVCQNMMQEAIDCWNQGILNNPNDRGYYEEKAMALLNQRRNLEVIKCSDEVNVIFQESQATNFIKIYALDNLKLLKKAIIARRLAKQDTTFQKSQL
ncbi:unnamed protein product [Paramecium primaurelia]|uniref:Tetratricopeptide repeat protein n=1 Tax=Paramecium primaurelia TaxID=5886 RepID=A0A8S1QDG8_PARPR|nr:unnamed protein product [Paramecium primaurelia]